MPPLRVAMTLEQSWHRVPGGTAVAALRLAEALAARPELEITGVAAAHRTPAPDPWSPAVVVRHLPLPRLALYEAWQRLRWPPVERWTGRVDVLHATTLAVPPRSAPLVVTIHDLAWLEYPELFTRRGVAFFDRGLALARADADLVMCSSRATHQACEVAGFESSRLRLVPLGARIARASPEDAGRVRTRYGLDRPYILWTGTIEPRKNLPGLLKAYARLGRELDLVLAGPKGWNEDLDALIAKSKGRVKALGFVPAPDLAGLYAGAEVFCFPSLLEGFGLPVLEAMAQGTPVVTSRGTSTEELAEGAGVLVDPRDADSIASGIASVLDDREIAARLAAAGWARAAEYTWERSAGLVASVYAEVAS